MNTHLRIIKDKIKDSNLRIIQLILPILRVTWQTFKLVTDARFRSENIAPLRFKKDYYQHSSYTEINRYPLIFKTCTDYLATHPRVKILSFGCSTGEEVFSLAKYMPYASIIGVDINDWCIKQCIKKNISPNLFFLHRLSDTFNQIDNFDAIFCMAVFQRTENRINNNSEAKGISFEQFEKEVGILDSKLKINGLLIIDNADFYFIDSRYSKNYIPLDFDANMVVNDRPLFDKNNKRIADKQLYYRVFIKKATYS